MSDNTTTGTFELIEVAEWLLAEIGLTLTAFIAGSRSRERARLIASGFTRATDDEEARMRLAFELVREVATAECLDTARAWLIGSDPWLSTGSPAEAIREGRHDEVRAAAQAFITDAGGA